MNEQQKSDGAFEQRLRAELKAIVAERAAAQAASEAITATPAWRRRGTRLALGGGVALAAVATALAVNAGGSNTSKAFAVEAQDGGGVTIKVYSAEDATGLEAALAEAGINSQVTWLPAGMACREPRFTPSTAKSSLGGTLGGWHVAGPGPALTIGVMSSEEWHERSREFSSGEISEEEFHNETANLSVDPTEFRPDQTVVVSGSPGPYEGNPEGGYEADFSIAEGPVGPCESVRIADGGSLAEMDRVIESEKSTQAGAGGELGSAPSSEAE